MREEERRGTGANNKLANLIARGLVATFRALSSLLSDSDFGAYRDPDCFSRADQILLRPRPHVGILSRKNHAGKKEIGGVVALSCQSR